MNENYESVHCFPDLVSSVASQVFKLIISLVSDDVTERRIDDMPLHRSQWDIG